MDPVAILREHIIYSCVIGSRAYGLEIDTSDTDTRGIFIPPADLHWSLTGIPEQIETEEQQECYWEVQKFITLALKGNPLILECLFTPIVLEADELGQELVAIRTSFLSKRIYQTYSGYADAQFRRLEHKSKDSALLNRKQAMHLIRLLLSGIHALHTGFIQVDVSEHREMLLAIRSGTMDWTRVVSLRDELRKALKKACATTRLPEEPDYAGANTFLLKARRAALDW